MRKVWLGLLAVLAMGQAAAQVTDTPIRTTEGCTVFTTATLAAIYRRSEIFSYESTWDGQCVDGLAEGLGTMTLSTVDNDGKRTNRWKVKQRHHQGMPFGFSRSVSTWTGKTRTSYAFFDGTESNAMSMGFSGLDAAVDQDDSPAPVIDLTRVAPEQYIQDGKTSLIFEKVPCELHKDLSQFAGCGFGAGEQKYDIYVTTLLAIDATTRLPTAGKKISPCPDPRTPANCAAMVIAQLEPIARNVEAFLEESRPAYLRRLADMRATLAPIEKAALARQQRVASEKAQAERAFADKLAKGGPGELFALADQLKDENNAAGARSALRALIKRFPDHALAKAAAAELLNR